MGIVSSRSGQVANPIAAQKLTQASSTAQASAAFSDDTRFVSFFADDAGYYVVTAAGTLATATDHRFQSGERVEIVVNKNFKLSTLLDTDTNTYITELA
jgi:hypothetical protein